MHRRVKPDIFNNLASEARILGTVNDEKVFRFECEYGITKLLLMYAMDLPVASSTTRSPNHQIDNPHKVVITICPGMCRTNLIRDFSALLRFPLTLFLYVFAQTAE